MDKRVDSSRGWAAELAEFLRRQPGVSAVKLDLDTRRVSVATLGPVDMGSLQATLKETLSAIHSELVAASASAAPAGFSIRKEGAATVLGRESCETVEKLWLWREMQWPEIGEEAGREEGEWKMLARFAALCGAAGIAAAACEHALPGMPWLSKGLFALGLIAGGWDAAIDTWANLRTGKVDIHFLMLAVAVGAAAIGAWGEGVLLLFLFSASGAMEEYALARTQREVRSLLATSPKRAMRIRADGSEEEVPVESLRAGDRLRVRPGDAFAADALVAKGSSASDESALTGEAQPVSKQVGDPVFSGTLNLWGAVEVEVSRPPSESTLQKIIRLIQTAQKLKAPSERFTDKFGTAYTFIVIGMAAAAFLVWWLGFGLPAFHNQEGARSAFYRAMTLMVVASPCALVLSIPSAILAAIAHGAKHGVLFRGGGAVERLADVGVVALDKTGTLTTGELAVVGCESYPPGGERRILELATALEAKSQHPIARAIVRHAQAQGVQAAEVEEFRSLTGKGLSGRMEGSLLMLGRREMLEHGPLAEWAKGLPPAPAEFSEVWVIAQNQVGRILLKDQIRGESKAVLEGMRRSGIRSVMLTGDRSHAAEAVARELGLDEVRAGLSPEGKVEAIVELKKEGRLVAMVGDGVNDAPCLAAADVSVAMGARGSDAALEQAEVILMHDRIENFMAAYTLSRRARRVIRQNLTVALGVVVVMVCATATGAVPLAAGVAAHEGSTVVVCLNSLRLLFGRNSG